MKMIKNNNFFLMIFFALSCLFAQLMIELEWETSRGYAQVIALDKEAILGMYFAIFKEPRLFFRTAFLKIKRLKPKGLRKKLILHVLSIALQGIKSSVLSCRQDVITDFRCECPTL